MNEAQPQEYSNTCLDRGLLVSLRDGELTPDETEQALTHLAVCPDCTADKRSLQTGSQEIYDLLTLLEPSSDEIPATATAFAALQSRLSVESCSRGIYDVGQTQSTQSPDVINAGSTMNRKPTRGRDSTGLEITGSAGSNVRPFKARKPQQRKLLWAAAAAAVLIALVLLPGTGALANQFLGLFQAQKFQLVSVNPESFRDGIGEDLQSFGNVNINFDNLNSITHSTLAQIEQDLNFNLLLPDSLPSGVGPARQFTLINSANGTFTFSAAKARAYLAQTGQGNVSIPPQLDGATFTITLAPGVIINYGKQCQTQSQVVNGSITGRFSSSSSASSAQNQSESGQNGSGPGLDMAALGCSGGKPFYIAEIPSPVIRATGNASLEDLRNFVLSLPDLSSGARLLLQNVNLNTGVVPLPIPPQVQAQQVATHGAQGELMTDSSLSLGAVIWQTGGIIYMAAGATSDSTQLMNTVNSLH
jgi:hypothetical protein